MNKIWKNNVFMYFMGATSVSSLTFQIYVVVFPLLVYSVSRSSVAMGAMRTIEYLPNIALGVLIGTIVDKFHRKIVVVVTLVLQVVAIFALVYVNTYYRHLWAMYVLSFLISCASTTLSITYHSLVPDIVDRSQLTTANSARQLIGSVTSTVGPALGGWILLQTSIQHALRFTVIGVVVMLATVSLIPIPRSAGGVSSQRSLSGAMREGVKTLFEIKDLLNITIIMFMINISGALSGAILLFYALNSFDVASGQVGVILACSALGSVIASLMGTFSRKLLPRGRILMWSIVISCVGQLVLFGSHSWVLIAIGVLLTGFSATTINIHFFTLRQELTPTRLLGRVTGATSMFTQLSLPFAYITSGILGLYVKENYIFLLSGLVLLLALLGTIRSSIMRLK